METGPFPLVVGVTGHRDLREADLPPLREAVCAVLNTYRTNLPRTAITILSSLADGADRLVARVALERGCSLAAALPMPREEFKTTLKDDAARAEFDWLLAQCTAQFVAPPLNRDIDWRQRRSIFATRIAPRT